MIKVDFSVKPICMNGKVGTTINFPYDEDFTISGSLELYLFLKLYFSEKGADLRFATDEEIEKYNGEGID